MIGRFRIVQRYRENKARQETRRVLLADLDSEINMVRNNIGVSKRQPGLRGTTSVWESRLKKLESKISY